MTAQSFCDWVNNDLLLSCHLVNEDGTAKGLITIPRERGINTERMLADDMRVVLSNHEDFSTEKTILEHYLEKEDTLHTFYPSSIAN